jgi:hypothetical protein
MPGWKKIAYPTFTCFVFIGYKSNLHQHKSNDAEDQGFKVRVSIRHDLQVWRGVIRIGKKSSHLQKLSLTSSDDLQRFPDPVHQIRESWKPIETSTTCI